MDKLDILNRDEFVEQLLKLVENISANNASTCFAINGPWGCGKTFVLDMFQEKLEQIQSEETFTEKYFVIRYDCWKFDYYEEPLVAIVSTMMSIIEEKTKLFPDGEKKRKIIGMLKAVGVALLSIGNATLRETTCFDIQKAYETIRDGKEEGAADYQDEHNYDAYFSFNKVMHKLIEVLRSLSKDYTIVFLVDELDRCLPEYAMKVLERLHHLTENQSNIITVLTIDKTQLLYSVERILGFKNPETYLKKFIAFEIKLDYGTVSEAIIEKYTDYIALFDKDIFPFDESVEECLQAIFKDVDIRTQEQLITKAMIAHRLLYSDKKDYSFMCMELLLAVMICVYQDDSCFSKTPVNASSFEKIFISGRKSSQPAFAGHFKEKLESINFMRGSGLHVQETVHVLPNRANLYGAILFTWYWMHPPAHDVAITHTRGDVYEIISKNYEELKKYAETIKMMS